MQDVIQAARDAEHAAKGVDRKGALALRVLKRSGESVEFVARFDSGALGLWAELGELRGSLSSRFIYRFLSKLRPVMFDTSKGKAGWVQERTNNGIDLSIIAREELRHSLVQQSDFKIEARDFAERWTESLKDLNPKDFLHFWMARAFLNRLEEHDSYS
jgi:hypothetical protein